MSALNRVGDFCVAVGFLLVLTFIIGYGFAYGVIEAGRRA